MLTLLIKGSPLQRLRDDNYMQVFHIVFTQN